MRRSVGASSLLYALFVPILAYAKPLTNLDSVILKNASSATSTVHVSNRHLVHRLPFVLLQSGGKFSVILTPCDGCYIRWTLFSADEKALSVAFSNRLYEATSKSDEDYADGDLLHEYEGRMQSSYETSSMNSRFGYVLITASETPCSVQVVFLSNMLWSLSDLVPTRRVRVYPFSSDRSVIIDWDQSDAAAMALGSDLEYEIVLSSGKPAQSSCSSTDYLSKITVVSDRRRSVHVGNLQAGLRLFISIFAKRLSTKESVALERATVVVPDSRFDSAFRIVAGSIVLSHLGSSHRSTNVHLMNVEQWHTSLFITLQPCSGYLKTVVFLNDRMLRQWYVEELKTLELYHVPAGVLSIRVSNDGHGETSYRLFVSTKSTDYPYLRMPYDTSLFVLEHGRTCRSVRLGWLEPAEAHSMCLFKRRQLDDYFTHLILEEPNQCQGPPYGSDVVFCRHLERQEDDYASTREVRGLRPNSTYRFDLYATKANGQTLPYRTVWVKTKQNC